MLTRLSLGKPLKIDFVVDEIVSSTPTPQPLSLLQRLGPAPTQTPAEVPPAKKATPTTAPAAPTVPVRRQAVKKGPKRVKKLQRPAVTAEQLDQEMEEYRKESLL